MSGTVAACRQWNLATAVVDRMRGQRRQRRAGFEFKTNREIQPHIERVGAKQLHVMRPIERQRSVPGGAKKADVAAEAELRRADRRVGRIVSRIVVKRRDPRIRLAVVVAEETLEVAGQPRPPIGRGQATSGSPAACSP